MGRELSLGNRRFVLFDGICIKQKYCGTDREGYYGSMYAQVCLWGFKGTLEIRLTEEEHKAVLEALKDIPECLMQQITIQQIEEEA